MCHDEVRPMFIGKYCVRFGSDIHQFCSNGCLERYKTKIRVCCYCQKNLDKVERVSSLTNKVRALSVIKTILNSLYLSTNRVD